MRAAIGRLTVGFLGLFAMLAAGLLTAPAAVSASAHFVGSPSIAVNNGGVTATGKIAGLGNQDVTINLEATVKVT